MQADFLRQSLLMLVVASPTLPLIDAHAAEVSAQVRAGVGISDNMARTAQAKVDETIATAGFDIGVTSQTRRLDLTLRSSFDYMDYLDDTFDQEWVGGLSGNAVIMLVEERVTWVIQDNFGQQLSDPFQPARPNNREDVNYFKTGPTINLLPGSRNKVQLEARYGRIDYETRPADNDRLDGTLTLGRSITRDSTLSLKVHGSRVEYDETALAPPFENYAGYVRFERAGNRNTLGLDIGYNEVEQAGINGDGLLFGVDWMRETSPNGRLTVSAGSRFSDQGNIFELSQGQSPQLGDTLDDPASVAPFQNNFVRLGYSIERDSYAISASVNGSQEDYKDGTGLDRDVYLGSLVLRRDMSRKVFAGALARLQRREYKYQNRRDDDLTLGIDVGYRVGDGLDVSLEYQHFQRNSVTAGADFTENRAFVRLAYTPRWGRQENN